MGVGGALGFGEVWAGVGEEEVCGRELFGGHGGNFVEEMFVVVEELLFEFSVIVADEYE